MGWFKMPPASVFAQPSSVRGTLNTQQQQGRERYVSTEAQLIQAIGEVAQRFSISAAGVVTSFGGSIAITSTFRATQTPYVIPETCVGLTIRTVGSAPIIATDADQGTLFVVKSAFVTLRDMVVFFGGAAGAASAWFNTFCETQTAPATATYDIRPVGLRLLDCVCFTDRIYVDNSVGGADDANITRVRVPSAPNGTHDACVVLDSPRGHLAHCQLDDGGGDSVTIGANGARCHTIANDLDGGDYTSTASGGFNTFSGNTNVATVTAHATDDTLGGNTA